MRSLGSSPAHEAIVKLLLALPGVAEAEEAEKQLRAARAAELMRLDDDTEAPDHDQSILGSVVAARGTVDEAEDDLRRNRHG